MSIKVGRKHHDMRIAGRIVGVRSTKQSVGIIIGAFDPNIISHSIAQKGGIENKGNLGTSRIHIERLMGMVEKDVENVDNVHKLGIKLLRATKENVIFWGKEAKQGSYRRKVM